MPRRRLGWGATSSEPDPAAAAADLQRAAAKLSTLALRDLNGRLTWYRTMPAELRSWVGVILQSAIGSFAAWYQDPAHHKAVSAEVFGSAPPS